MHFLFIFVAFIKAAVINISILSLCHLHGWGFTHHVINILVVTISIETGITMQLFYKLVHK